MTRDLLPGAYPFKFVLDEHWTASADYPVTTVCLLCVVVVVCVL